MTHGHTLRKVISFYYLRWRIIIENKNPAGIPTKQIVTVLTFMAVTSHKMCFVKVIKSFISCYYAHNKTVVILRPRTVINMSLYMLYGQCRLSRAHFITSRARFLYHVKHKPEVTIFFFWKCPSALQFDNRNNRVGYNSYAIGLSPQTSERIEVMWQYGNQNTIYSQRSDYLLINNGKFHREPC